MARKVQIYQGAIKKLYVAKETVDRGQKSYDLESMVLKKDALFYENFFRRKISIDHDMYLPTEEEAYAFCKRQTIGGIDNIDRATCVYADYDHMKPHSEVSSTELKRLIKTAKQKRSY